MARQPAAHRDIIVVGASAGGVDALTSLAAQLPADFPAAVCMVLHLSVGHRSRLPELLARAGVLPAVHPRPEEPLLPGRIYVAPTDQHLLIERDRVLVNSGPRENGHRPAVDPLFRSAARAYGPRVIGVVLTGALDCGTSGLLAIKAQGGLAVVQDPADAYCPDMPRSALEFVKVDHTVKLAGLGALLRRLVTEPLPRQEPPAPSKRLQKEVSIMSRSGHVHSDPDYTGNPSLFSCPDCGGVLFEMDEQGFLRYRCRVGHGFTAKALSVNQQTSMDGALWAALRALEESAALSRRMAGRARERNHGHTAQRYETRARTTEEQAELVRQLVLHNSTRPPPEEDLPEEPSPGGERLEKA